MTSLAPILDVDGVQKIFGERIVLKSAGFALYPGRITCLMGLNGAGKTTLFRVAAGLVRSDNGIVRFKQKYVERPRLARLAKEGLMYSAQESALTTSFTVREHLVTMAAASRSLAQMEQVVRDCGIGPVLDQRSRDLSGGERQRVSLALALLRRPECLIMDEPFVGIAPVDAPILAQGLRTLRERGTAIGISGHDVRELLDVSDEVIWVVAGTTHWLGTPDEARAHDQFRREYLGPSVWAR